MKSIAVCTFALLFAGALIADDRDWPLKFDAAAEWKIEYKGDGIDFFTLTRPEGENVLLLISRWPAPGGVDQIPSFIVQMAQAFQEEMRKDKKLQLGLEAYRAEKIQGDAFSGEAAVFQGDDGIYQTMFMISDGDGIWNGQFNGSKTMWSEAVKILTKLQRAPRKGDD